MYINVCVYMNEFTYIIYIFMIFRKKNEIIFLSEKISYETKYFVKDKTLKLIFL